MCRAVTRSCLRGAMGQAICGCVRSSCQQGGPNSGGGAGTLCGEGGRVQRHGGLHSAFLKWGFAGPTIDMSDLGRRQGDHVQDESMSSLAAVTAVQGTRRTPANTVGRIGEACSVQQHLSITARVGLGACGCTYPVCKPGICLAAVQTRFKAVGRCVHHSRISMEENVAALKPCVCLCLRGLVGKGIRGDCTVGGRMHSAERFGFGPWCSVLCRRSREGAACEKWRGSAHGVHKQLTPRVMMCWPGPSGQLRSLPAGLTQLRTPGGVCHACGSTTPMDKHKCKQART